MATVRYNVNLRTFLNSVSNSRKIRDTWTQENLSLIRERIAYRLFSLGLNSDDKLMRLAKDWPPPQPRGAAYRTYKYRYRTGRLINSLKVSRLQKYNLRISFSREQVVLDTLIKRYGEMFEPSPSDLEYIKYIFLRNFFNIRGSEPTVRVRGNAKYVKGRIRL